MSKEPVMLYKLKQDGAIGTFVGVKPTTLAEQGYAEQAMKGWRAHNLHVALPEGARMLIFGQEKPFQINRRQRLLIVGKSFDPKIAHTGRWLQGQGVSIGCVSYAWYCTDDGELFLDFQQKMLDFIPSLGQSRRRWRQRAGVCQQEEQPPV